jgi:hypothetical protein
VADAPRVADYGLECVPDGGPAFARSGAEGCPEGHWYSNFPLGTPVLVLPLLGLMKGGLALAGPLVPHAGFFARREVAAFFAGDLLGGRPLAELWCASTIGALTVWVQYQIALLFLARRAAIWYALLFAFGTTEWSLASRNLSPHGLTLLLLSAALYLLLQDGDGEGERVGGRKRLPHYGLAGLLLALAFAVRPSNAISCVVLAVYVAIHRRAQLLRFLLWAAPVAVVFFSYQVMVRHSLIPLLRRQMRNPFWGSVDELFQPIARTVHFLPSSLLAGGDGAGVEAAMVRRIA